MAQDKGPTILIVMWTTTSIATLFVAARLFTRIRILRNIGLDDYLIASSMVIGLLFVSLATAAVTAGDGKHVSALSRYRFERAAMLNTAAPMRAMWTSGLGNCWSPSVVVDYSIFAGGISTLLYLPTLKSSLTMPIRRKGLLLIAFALGSCAAIVAVVKCTHIPGLADESDPTYSTSELVIWTNVESNSIIIAACIPTCIPLLEKLFYKRGANGFHNQQVAYNPKPPRPQNKEFLFQASRHAVDTEMEVSRIRRTDEIIIAIE
ncbi:hypothetical protein UA08_09457 [Talaromyces atroroseus]|uniref:Rhodopsin domain-containing protein n=1 Tax=Talaromyces atroroseus TaxID=1441469 RepID=A0A225ABZ2_TALAT|nr:hypothetical protein UA08_09457 [Talaromyces atroroseus]OKL55304.1 hypothetical protein UA08_09457 [Talaromyces atroroseus]